MTACALARLSPRAWGSVRPRSGFLGIERARRRVQILRRALLPLIAPPRTGAVAPPLGRSVYIGFTVTCIQILHDLALSAGSNARSACCWPCGRGAEMERGRKNGVGVMTGCPGRLLRFELSKTNEARKEGRKREQEGHCFRSGSGHHPFACMRLAEPRSCSGDRGFFSLGSRGAGGVDMSVWPASGEDKGFLPR